MMRLAACSLLGAAVSVAACSLDGFATGSASGSGGAGPGSGGAGAAGGGTAGSGGGQGGSVPLPCMTEPWAEIEVSTGGPATEPAVAWTGAAWAIAWQDGRDGNPEIYFARVSADGGSVLGELRVTNDGAESLRPAIAWSGSEHALAFEDTRDGNSAAYMARIDAAGAKIGGDIQVWKGSGAPKSPVIAWSGASYVLTWEDFRDSGFKIHSGLVDAGGNVVAADQRITDPAVDPPGDATFSAIARADDQYGIAWQDTRDGNSEIYFAGLDDGGLKLGTEARITNTPDNGTDTGIAWDGGAYGVAWREGGGSPAIRLARIAEGGGKLAELALADPGDGGWPAVAGTAAGWAVAWQHKTDGVYFTLVDAAVTNAPAPVRVAGGTGAVERASIAWSGSSYGLAWQDNRGGAPRIYFASCTP